MLPSLVYFWRAPLLRSALFCLRDQSGGRTPCVGPPLRGHVTASLGKSGGMEAFPVPSKSLLSCLQCFVSPLRGSFHICNRFITVFCHCFRVICLSHVFHPLFLTANDRPVIYRTVGHRTSCDRVFQRFPPIRWSYNTCVSTFLFTLSFLLNLHPPAFWCLATECFVHSANWSYGGVFLLLSTPCRILSILTLTIFVTQLHFLVTNCGPPSGYS